MKSQEAPEAGDEAVQLMEYGTTEIENREYSREHLFIIVRTGSVIATYRTLDIGRTSTFPTEPIIKQAERLRAAQGR